MPDRHPHNLPCPLTPFVGREKELAEIARILGDPICRLLTLLGPGGIGKTRLALQWATEQRATFPDGVFFVPLDALGSAADLPFALADALQLILCPERDARDHLLAFLRPRAALLVLDDLEHLLEEVGLVTEILRVAPAVKALATSRARLKLPGEWLLEVRGLECPPEGEVEAIENYSAVQLFVQGARRVEPGFRLAGADQAAVARLCRLVEGLPLAIDLAAAQVRALGCQELAQSLERQLDALTLTVRGGPERHRSLWAACEHSWRVLSAAERQALARLAVFRGGFCTKAAQQVAGVTLPLLSGLMDKSLLRRTPSGRYEAPEVLRQFGQEKLAADPPQEARTREQHSRHYAGWLQGWEAALEGDELCRALAALDEELENLRRAWAWAAEQGQAELLAACLPSLYRYYELRGRFQEGQAALGRAVAGLRQPGQSPAVLSPQVVWSALARQGVFDYRLGRYAQARERLEQSLEALRRLDKAGEVAFCLLHLAHIAARQEERQAAGELFQQALTWARTACREPSRTAAAHSLEVGALCGLGNVALQEGDYATARAHYAPALQLCRERGGRRSASALLNNLGVIADHLGEYVQAREDYAASLELKQAAGDRPGEAIALLNRGFAAHRLGEYGQARADYECALALSREMGMPWLEGMGLARLGLLWHHQGQHEAAQECGQGALDIAQELGERSLQALALTLLGRAGEGQEQWAASADAYQRALALRQALRQPALVAEVQAGLARVCLAQGEPAKAQVEEIVRCLQTHTLTDTEEPCRIYLTCYRVLCAANDPRARGILNAAHNLLQEQAARINDEEMRHSFLKRVAAHREILRELAMVTTDSLTARERQVLRLVTAGLTNREISAQLAISEATVKRHLSNVYQKLDVRNRVQAVNKAREMEGQTLPDL